MNKTKNRTYTKYVIENDLDGYQLLNNFLHYLLILGLFTKREYPTFREKDAWCKRHD